MEEGLTEKNAYEEGKRRKRRRRREKEIYMEEARN